MAVGEAFMAMVMEEVGAVAGAMDTAVTALAEADTDPAGADTVVMVDTAAEEDLALVTAGLLLVPQVIRHLVIQAGLHIATQATSYQEGPREYNLIQMAEDQHRQQEGLLKAAVGNLYHPVAGTIVNQHRLPLTEAVLQGVPTARLKEVNLLRLSKEATHRHKAGAIMLLLQGKVVQPVNTEARLLHAVPADLPVVDTMADIAADPVVDIVAVADPMADIAAAVVDVVRAAVEDIVQEEEAEEDIQAAVEVEDTDNKAS
jgi:hypothetical protein